MKSVGPVISPEPASAPEDTVCSGASRRANASAVDRSHWSASALTGSSRSRSARIGCLPSSAGSAANWSRSRVASSSSSQRAGQVEDGDAVQAVGRDDVVARRQLGAVGHEQDVRRRRPLVGAEPRPVAEVRRQQRGDLGEGRADHPHRPDGVGLLGALGVRQPLEPVPVHEVLLRAEHRDDEVVGGVEGGGRADHRAGQRPRGVLRRRTARPGRRRAGRCWPAASAAAGGRRAGGAGRRRRPGRPRRSGRSRAAPAPGRAAASRRRTGRGGSRRRCCRAPTPATAPRRARAGRWGRGGAS